MLAPLEIAVLQEPLLVSGSEDGTAKALPARLSAVIQCVWREGVEPQRRAKVEVCSRAAGDSAGPQRHCYMRAIRG